MNSVKKIADSRVGLVMGTNSFLNFQPTDRIGLTKLQVLQHSARTAVTAVISLLAARLLNLPQSYWAPVTTLVITQSSLGSTLAVSQQRFIGTGLGAALGSIIVAYFGANLLAFGASIFVMGLCCAVVHADRSAYRFGGVTLAIVLLPAAHTSCLASGFPSVRGSVDRDHCGADHDDVVAREQHSQESVITQLARLGQKRHSTHLDKAT